jgi:hypothetical protein
MRLKPFVLLFLWMPLTGLAQSQSAQDPQLRIEVDVTLSVTKNKKDDWIELRSQRKRLRMGIPTTVQFITLPE